MSFPKKLPKKRPGAPSSHNPVNYTPPSVSNIKQLCEAADISGAEAARTVGITRKETTTAEGYFCLSSTLTNVAFSRFTRTGAQPMKFAWWAMLNILALDSDPTDWRGGMPDHVAPSGTPRRKSRRLVEQLSVECDLSRKARATNNPLNYLPPGPSTILAARQQAGYTQVEAANAVGLPWRTWQTYEIGTPRKIKGKFTRTPLPMPFPVWAAFNILVLGDSAAKWRAGLPGPKSPFPRTGYRATGGGKNLMQKSADVIRTRLNQPLPKSRPKKRKAPGARPASTRHAPARTP